MTTDHLTAQARHNEGMALRQIEQYIPTEHYCCYCGWRFKSIGEYKTDSYRWWYTFEGRSEIKSDGICGQCLDKQIQEIKKLA